jgi:hypothetical protein
MGFTLCDSFSVFDPSFLHLPSVGLHHLARERVLVGTLGVLSSRKERHASQTEATASQLLMLLTPSIIP